MAVVSSAKQYFIKLLVDKNLHTRIAANGKKRRNVDMGHIAHIVRLACMVFGLAFSLSSQSAAQSVVITGRVLDSITHSPLQNVSVRIKAAGKGTLTDSTGRFKLVADKNAGQLLVTMVGYNQKLLALGTSPTLGLVVLLSDATTSLEGVTVKYKKGKYRNKDNPAVALIREVIRHKPLNALSAHAYASYKKYDKTQLSITNLPQRMIDLGLIHRYHFLFENIDTLKVTGKRLIPLYIAESLSQVNYRAHPEKKNTLVLAQKSVNYGEFVDMQGIQGLLSNLYGDVDLYIDKIDLFGTQLLSPITDAAPAFYMYFIMDTTMQNGVPTVKIAFMPRNPDDLLFRGILFVPLDGKYAVAKADLGTSKRINLNFVQSLKINLAYKKDTLGQYYLSSSDMLADLGVFEKSLGMYGERQVYNTVFRTSGTAPDSLFSGLSEDSSAQVPHAAESYWDSARSVPLSHTEAMIYKNIDSLQGMRSFHQVMDIGTMLTVGYKQAGVFNVGPIRSFYSYNPLEGSRPEFGGRSTPKLSKTFYGDGYLAYGTKDKLWKYNANLYWAFNHHSVYNYFPQHYLRVGYQRDTRIPGQINSFSSGSSFLNSFTQGPNNQWLYNDLFHIDYVHELKSHFSYNFGYQYWRQQPAGSLYYLYQNAGNQFDTVHQLTTSTLSVTLRWAPHEQFIQNQLARFDIINHYPIITLNYVRGIKRLAGGQYNYDALHLNIFRRFYLAPLGFTDVTFDAGYLSGQLPFPLLYIHPANKSFVYLTDAYNLMNPAEFVSDHFAGINIDHYFNGFFLNKVPLIKWLKLREVVSAKILYGGVRDENNPGKNPAQMRFPIIDGATTTHILGGQPYVEASFGIANIFKVLRVDLVKRMTYLQNPGINTWGYRFSTAVNF